MSLPGGSTMSTTFEREIIPQAEEGKELLPGSGSKRDHEGHHDPVTSICLTG